MIEKKALSIEEKTLDPCVQICVRDREDEICLGCGRSTDEINNWAHLTRDERYDIALTLESRLEAQIAKRRQRRHGRKGRRAGAGESITRSINPDTSQG